MSQLCDLSARSILRQARPIRRNEDLLCEALAVPRILSSREDRARL
jgi:hypothetical protein